MFYSSWMSCIKDDVKITQLAIPGAHNAGTKGMVHMGCCQLGTVLEQFEYGVREFGIRVKQKHGEAYIAHGLSRGVKVEKVFADFEKILEKYPDEFFIIDIRSYQDQKVGPFTLKYHCAPEIINELIEKYLRPADYAFTDFEHIKDVTLADIRNSGKRYLIHHEDEEYIYSRNTYLLEPWDAKLFGLKPEKFWQENLNYLRNLESEGFFWFQTQQTPNPGTEIGFTWPNKLDELDRPFFPLMMKEIAQNPEMLAKINIVAGDFMTRDHMKENEILRFNLLKGFVKPEFEEYYAKTIGETV